MTLFCTVASLKVPTMIVFDVATKVLGTELFPQHNIADLNSGISFIALLSQEKLLRWKEINTRARAHARTHARTRTRTLPSISRFVWSAIRSKLIYSKNKFAAAYSNLVKDFLLEKQRDLLVHLHKLTELPSQQP